MISQYSDWSVGWVTRVWFLAGADIFSLCHLVQTVCGANPAFYPVGTGSSFSRVWSWPLTSI